MSQFSFFDFIFFFFKQKTAYEMRISDWSSDVCSSDLSFNGINTASLSASRMPFYLINCTDLRRSILRLKAKFHFRDRSATSNFAPLHAKMSKLEIGRASCRERVCQYV